MKKILNFGAVLLTVAAIGFVGCSHSLNVKQTEVGGSNKITNGTFDVAGFKDSANGISLEASKTTKTAEVVLFTGRDNFILFKGYSYDGDNTELFFAPKTRSIVTSTPSNYSYNETYYSINGAAIATKYYGSAVNDKKVPSQDALVWTKYTYYNGDDDKPQFGEEILYPLSPDYVKTTVIGEGTSWEYKYTEKFCKDTKDDPSKGEVEYDADEHAIVAVQGKYYAVTSVGDDTFKDSNDDYDLYADKETSFYPGWWLSSTKVTKGSDSITYSYKWVSVSDMDYDWDDTSYKTIYKRKAYNKGYATYTFTSGGKVTYEYEEKEYKNGTELSTVSYFNEKGEKVTGSWTNNNGLIAMTFDGVYRTSEYGREKVGSWYDYLYWNGKNFGRAEYIGSYYEGSLPNAATSGSAKEDKTTRWYLGD